MFKNVLIIAVLVFYSSCTNNDKRGPALYKEICGTWRDAGVRIQMNTFGNSDSTSIVEVTEKDWFKYMTVRPTLTTYLKDGTYFAEHRNLQDSLILRPAGKWWIIEDSLFVLDTFPDRGTQFQYKVELGKKSMLLYGTEDSDNDGKRDDDYLGTMKKIK